MSISIIFVYAVALTISFVSMTFAERDSDFKKRIDQELQTATLDVRTGFAGSGFEISADSNSSSVSFSLSRDWDSPSIGQNFKPTKYLKTNVVSAKFSSPINKSTKLGDFVTNSGISNNTSVELSYSGVVVRNIPFPITKERTIELLIKGRDSCDRNANNSEEKKKCKNAKLKDLKKYLSQAERDEFADTEFLNTPIWLYGLAGSIGYGNFDFRDPMSFEKKKEDKVPYSLSVYLGVSPNKRPIYFGAGYEYKIDYKDARNQTLCPMITDGAIQECFTDSFLEPRRDIDSTFYLLSRASQNIKISKNLSIPIGLEVKLAYDTNNDVFGISAPIYIVADKKGNLKGGVRVTWEDDEKDVNIGVFVGGNFNLFSNK